MSLHPTRWRYLHHRGDDLIWASGVGELDGSIKRGSPEEAELRRSQPWGVNALADDGEEAMLDVFFRGATPPTAFYIHLVNDTPVETDSLADLTGEVTGTGYAAIEVSRDSTDWPTLALDSGDFQVVSDDFVFTAGGNWTAATYAVLGTTSDMTGLLVVYNALGATRTLIAPDTLTVSLAVKLA